MPPAELQQNRAGAYAFYLLFAFQGVFSYGKYHRRSTWHADAAEWEKKAEDLASRFIKNFAKYESNEAGKALVAAGPQK